MELKSVILIILATTTFILAGILNTDIGPCSQEREDLLNDKNKRSVSGGRKRF